MAGNRPRRGNVEDPNAELYRTIGGLATYVQNMSQEWREYQNQNRNPPPEQDRAEEVARRRLKDFRNFKPSTFEGGNDPEAAAHWLQAMEHVFEQMGCPEDSKVNYVSHQLVGEALTWWKGARALIRAQNLELTWAVFRQVFLDKYFPKSVRKMKHTEFLGLKQEDLSVEDYITRFGQLAAYANFDRNIYDEDWLMEKFESGLHPEIRKMTLTSANRTLPELINQCRQAENILNESKTMHRSSTQFYDEDSDDSPIRNSTGTDKGKDPQMQMQAQAANFKKNYNPGQTSAERQIYNVCDFCGKTHPGECRRKDNSCFRCGQSGHFISDCPQKP